MFNVPAPFLRINWRRFIMVDQKKQPKRTRKQTKKVHKQKETIKKEPFQSMNQPEMEHVSGETEVNPSPQLKTTMIDSGEDRMLRYRKNPPCSKCGAHPTICMIRRISYELRRCRMCGHRWEITG